MPQDLFRAASELPRRLGGRRIGEIDAADRGERTAQLLEQSWGADSQGRRRLLDEVVLLNGPVAEAIASRYRARGIDSDDLVQVAYLGLVKAAHGYRPEQGPTFLAYAVPTISGEIKRHFRDAGWMIRPPRRLQELRAASHAAASDLLVELGRPATPQEIADVLEVGVDQVREAEVAHAGYSALSLDAPGPTDGGTVLADLLVDDSDSYAHVEDREVLRPALGALSERDRQILLLRFVRGYTQEQIGNEIGVSQMQVSRLLTRILTELRRELSDDDVDPPPEEATGRS